MGDSETFQSLNPANREHIVGTVPRTPKEQVDAAVAAAPQAFLTWREWSWVKRGEVIDGSPSSSSARRRA
ncbi:MAG: aldehyde dehydrogenase family protein [Fimbriimonadaceae bacterium]|nr:MAG: aldehyde dehydrogenase family protein [Fimbriimonadaceae bacterium]